MNHYSCIGRIGKDAVVRHTGAGEPVAGWTLAVDSGYGKNKQTLWWDCSLWGKRAEALAEYLVKGVQLGVTGEVGTREHEGKTYLTLRVADVTLIGKRDESRAASTAEHATDRARGGGHGKPAPLDDFEDSEIPF